MPGLGLGITARRGGLSPAIAASLPSLDLDFLKQGYQMSLIGKAFSEIFTFSRASGGGRINASGQFEWVAANQPRFDYDPVTLQPKGILIEEQRTNYIRNNTMVGAAVGVIGSGGALPTNWMVNGGSGWTLNQQVVALGSESGMAYIDLRLWGTPTAGQNWITVMADTSWPTLPISQGGMATLSAYLKAISGGVPGASANVNELNSGTSINNLSSSLFASLDASLKRYSAVLTSITAGTTHFAQPRLTFTVTAGAPFDFTFRIAVPGIEVGAFATSPILTSGSQVTRAADNPSLNTLSPWYSDAAGVFVAEFDAFGSTQASVYSFVSGNYCKAAVLASGNIVVGQQNVGQAASLGAKTVVSKVAVLSARSADGAASLNGAVPVTFTNRNAAGPATQINLGRAENGSSEYLNGHLRRFRFFPGLRTSNQVQALPA